MLTSNCYNDTQKKFDLGTTESANPFRKQEPDKSF